MQVRTKLFALVLALALAGASGWAMSVSHVATVHSQQSAQAQSASGKVKSVSGTSFSLEVTKGNDPETISFVTNGSTRIEGKLEVGANATVEYRPENGKNVALHVVVESPNQ